MLAFETVAFLVTGAALAGLVMGLVGFGTGLAALGFWLFVVDPVLAVPLVSICSLATTAFTLRAYAHAISWARLAPFFAGAAAGLPLGILLLARLDPAIFKIAMGLFLIGAQCKRGLAQPRLHVDHGAVKIEGQNFHLALEDAGFTHLVFPSASWGPDRRI